MTEERYNEILKKYFNIDKLKPQQFEIISNLVENNKNVIGILSTGFGKSMTFILLHLITNKTVIVISPLISLMTDQKENLEKKNIPVLILNSTNNNKYSDMQLVLDGEEKIIYITPEYLLICEQFIRRLVENDRLALVCFDEVHIMHEWGNSFRDSYLKAKVIREWIGDVPVLALSATVTENILKQTIELLKLEDALIVKTSYDRPNLYLEIKEKTKIKKDLFELLTKYKDDYIIIYCQTRKNTEKVSQEINDMGTIKTYPFHAGLPVKQREKIQRRYKKGKYKAIVSTIAFGLGIDIPNIRLVLHYNCSKNLEEYYQCIGRTSRDGKPGECYMFYSGKDFKISKFMLRDTPASEYKDEEEEKCKQIQQFIFNRKCRRQVLLKYFGEDYLKNCNNCDNCKKQTPKIDITIDACRILLIIGEFNHFGKNTLVNIIKGSVAKNMTDKMRNCIHYGFGKSKSVEWWKKVITHLVNEKYLEEKEIDGGFCNYITLNTQGDKYINNFIDIYTDIMINRDFNDPIDDSNKIYM
jgi:ATP-dependent DNA helicase RecQ